MLNAKNQYLNSDLSADEILANIRRKLGIIDENTNNSLQPQEESYEFDAMDDEDFSLEDTNTQETQNTDFLDDDFNFTEDFTKKSPANNSDVNKAYRAYQNTMNSAYNNYNDDTKTSNTTKTNNTTTDINQEDWTLGIIEDFDSFLAKEMNQIKKSDVMENTNLENNNNQSSFEISDENPSNDVMQIHLQENLINDVQNTQSHHMTSSMEMPLLMNFEQFIKDQITSWCNQNLESVCYKIIKEELGKEKKAK